MHLNSCNLSQHSISQAQAFCPWICPISVCKAIFQGFVTGHICQQSCGRNIENYRCALAPLFSSCSTPRLLTNRQTLMLKTTSLIPIPEKQLGSPHEPQQILSHRIRNLWTPVAQEEFRGWATASQISRNISPARTLWTLQQARPPGKLSQKCCLGKIIKNFGFVQDSWASVRPGESYLCSFLPKCLVLQSSGTPWQFKSRLVVPVLQWLQQLSAVPV